MVAAVEHKMCDQNQVKAFVLVLLMKRKYRSSFLLKGRYRENAKIFGLSINTYQLYIKRAVEYGFLVPEKNGYRAKSLFTIIKQFCWENGVQVSAHRLLKSPKKLNFKKVLSSFERILYHDTLLASQFKNVHLFRLQSERVKKANGYVAGDEFVDRGEVVSSVRQIQSKFGWGLQKCLQVMTAKNNLYSCRYNFKFFKGCNPENRARLEYAHPKAKIIGYPNTDSIKVCYGSTMVCSRLNKSCKVRGRVVNVQGMVDMAEILEKYNAGCNKPSFNGFSQSQIESLKLPSRILKKEELYKLLGSKLKRRKLYIA